MIRFDDVAEELRLAEFDGGVMRCVVAEERRGVCTALVEGDSVRLVMQRDGASYPGDGTVQPDTPLVRSRLRDAANRTTTLPDRGDKQ